MGYSVITGIGCILRDIDTFYRKDIGYLSYICRTVLTKKNLPFGEAVYYIDFKRKMVPLDRIELTTSSLLMMRSTI